MNEVYAILVSAFVFLCLSFIANILLARHKFAHVPLGLLVYLLMSVLIFFAFTDFLVNTLKRNGVKIYYSHNDMVLMFAIVLICFIVFIINGTRIIMKYRNRRLT
jgi:hypothetical protein